VTKMRVGVRAHSRWRIALVVGALSVACLIPLASPGAASASSVVCGGRLKFDDKLARFTGLIYRFKCTENILAFSVVSSKQIDFSTPSSWPTSMAQGLWDRGSSSRARAHSDRASGSAAIRDLPGSACWRATR
jgi:hypothetical protein